MPETVLTNTFHVDATPEAVFDHLTTPENYVGLSPLVVAVKDVDRSDPKVIRYTSIERFRLLGVLKYDNPIKVELFTDTTDDLAVHGKVRSPGNVTLAYRFTMTPHDKGTHFTDHLTLTAPAYLLRFASGQARKVQLARAEILTTRLKA